MRFGNANQNAGRYLEQTNAFGPDAVRGRSEFGRFDPSVPADSGSDARMMPEMDREMEPSMPDFGGGPSGGDVDSWFY